MSDIEKKLDALLHRFNEFEKLIIAAIPRSRRTKKIQNITATPAELLDQRVAAVVACFEKNIKMSVFNRRKANFPLYLLEKITDTYGEFGAMTEAILINRTSMLKIFQPVFIYNEKTANEVARIAVREAAHRGAFVLQQLCDSNIKTSSDVKENTTMLVLSHACYARLNKEDVVETPTKTVVQWSPDCSPDWKGKLKEREEFCEKCGCELENGKCEDCDTEEEGEEEGEEGEEGEEEGEEVI